MLLSKFKNLTLFENIPESFLEQLETECSEININKDDFLFRQGDKGEGMYIIVEGEIEIITHTEKSTDHVITVLKSGQVFGEVSLLEINKRIASARAKHDCKLLYLSINKFTKLIDANDPHALRISHNIARIMVDRLDRANKLITDLSQASEEKGAKVVHKKSSAQREVARFKEKLLNEGLF